MQGSSEEKDIENRLMDMGRGEDRVRCMERETWKLILLYVSQWEFANVHIANGNLLYVLGNSNRGSLSN